MTTTRAALSAFRRGAAVLTGHPPKRRLIGLDPDGAGRGHPPRGRASRRHSAPMPPAPSSRRTSSPLEVRPHEGGAFFTGYYEPIVAGSRQASAAFPTPLYAPPADLVEIDPDNPPPGIEPGYRFARKTGDGTRPLSRPRRDRSGGALRGQGLEIAWLADPVDAFFIHIQGSARLRLAEGGEMRVTYAAKTGHPYTGIGRELIAMGALPKGGATMQHDPRLARRAPGRGAGGDGPEPLLHLLPRGAGRRSRARAGRRREGAADRRAEPRRRPPDPQLRHAGLRRGDAAPTARRGVG